MLIARIAVLFLACWSAAALADSTWQASNPRAYHVEIRRTANGIPHIKAQSWASLGYGYGYAQATDNLCSMAEAFVTYRGDRSRFFGAQAHLNGQSTLGQPANLDADFFFKLLDTDAIAQQYRNAQTPDMQQLITGFAAGYNRYLADLPGGDAKAHQACRRAAWLGPITDADVYRRLYAANLAGGYTRFISAIATAVPPGAPPVTSKLARSFNPEQVALGGHTGVGSNGLAFGRASSANGQALLLGNPHWFWHGPDRLYQAQLTLPGQMDVSGASMLGVPVIMLGYNQNVAWTHTVSNARRFGVFELTLAPNQPTAYMLDGKAVAMTPVPLTVLIQQPGGVLKAVSRTLYLSHYGPLVNLPGAGWAMNRAFALRDINAANFGVFANFMAWGKARSLDEFIRINKAMAAMPWLSTIAIGRDAPQVWFSEIGAIPSVSDGLWADCAAASSQTLAPMLPGVPVLDGARAACNWQAQPGATVPGAFAAYSLPQLLRPDAVANMNNSAWLTNPAAPLTGYPRMLGGVGPLSWRARSAYVQAQQLATQPVTSTALRTMALGSRAYTAEIMKQPLLDAVCKQRLVRVRLDLANGTRFKTPRQVDISQACAVLQRWNNTGNANAVGADLWDGWWARLDRLPDATLFATPFSSADPIHTPRGIKLPNPQLAEALAATVLDMQQRGIALDSQRGANLYVTKGKQRIALYGGCEVAGYFTATCAYAQRGTLTDADLIGNSYLQVVTFGAQGVEAYTQLSHGLSDDPASPHFVDATQDYAAQRWQLQPAMLADPALQAQILEGPAQP